MTAARLGNSGPFYLYLNKSGNYIIMISKIVNVVVTLNVGERNYELPQGRQVVLGNGHIQKSYQEILCYSSSVNGNSLIEKIIKL